MMEENEFTVLIPQYYKIFAVNRYCKFGVYLKVYKPSDLGGIGFSFSFASFVGEIENYLNVIENYLDVNMAWGYCEVDLKISDLEIGTGFFSLPLVQVVLFLRFVVYP